MRKRIVVTVLLLVMLASQAVSVLAAPPMKGYIYSSERVPTAAPDAYKFDVAIDGDSYGIGTFNEPSDVAVDKDNYIYILDAGNQRVCVFDENKNLVRLLNVFNYKGEALTLNGPQGLCVYEYFDRKLLYVSDTENGRIFRLDLTEQLNGQVDRDAPIEIDKMYGKPYIDIVKEDTPYYPTKFIVDRAERIFVLGRTINRGIIKLDSEGEFTTFFGAPDVSYTLVEKFWRMISTEKQLEVSMKYVPTEYSNITMDSRGFLYVTTANVERKKLYSTFDSDPTDVTGRSENAIVKKLAADGTDILSRTGLHPPVGDLSVLNPNATEAVLAGMSSFVDVCVNDYDVYTIIDDQRCRVFTYDDDSNLLFVFGGKGTQNGTFQKPTAVSYFKDDQICVLDKRSAALSFFTPTDYGAAILNAVRLYNNGFYEESEEQWNRVLEMNSNMTLAYGGVGKAKLRSGEYKVAMTNFRIAKDTEYYSKALEAYLSEVIGNKFTYIFLVIIGAYLIYEIFKLSKRLKRFLREGVKKVV